MNEKQPQRKKVYFSILYTVFTTKETIFINKVVGQLPKEINWLNLTAISVSQDPSFSCGKTLAVAQLKLDHNWRCSLPRINVDSSTSLFTD